jgi:hypothetical protein
MTKSKIFIYSFLFICFVTFFTINNSIATRRKVKYDTIQVFHDPLDNQFYINKLVLQRGYRERILINNNIIIIDSTNMDGILFGICTKNKIDCIEKTFDNNLKHSFVLNDGLYVLKIKSTNQYPKIENRFYIRNVNPIY